jgi:hypothetical protein
MIFLKIFSITKLTLWVANIKLIGWIKLERNAFNFRSRVRSKLMFLNLRNGNGKTSIWIAAAAAP